MQSVPAVSAHFNGGINLPDTETVMREIVDRVGVGLRRIPDGETGERANWIGFQLPVFECTPGLRATTDMISDRYDGNQRIGLDGTVPVGELKWPQIGYASAYQASYETFRKLCNEGTIPTGVRFQVEYPTPLASIAFWVQPEYQDELEPSYEDALFGDLDTFLRAVPAADVAVQWDVAIEFGIVEKAYAQKPARSFKDIVARLARCVNQVPSSVPVGLHLCYGDFFHRHFAPPESLATQVRVLNALQGETCRSIDWVSFTVPPDRQDVGFFAPLGELEVSNAQTELNFSLVSYSERTDADITTQVALIDERLAALGITTWGICTECGMARVDERDVPTLLNRYREILTSNVDRE